MVDCSQFYLKDSPKLKKRQVFKVKGTRGLKGKNMKKNHLNK